MEENKEYDVQNTDKTVEKPNHNLLCDLLFGIFIGIAFIIPGFSGGSVAAILGIYERIVNALTDVFTQTRKALRTLLPIFVGLVGGALVFTFPIGYMLSSFPIPTVSLFVGLAIGGVPNLMSGLKGKPSAGELALMSASVLIAFLISFVPMNARVDLIGMSLDGYILLFLVGVLASCALVVPGISGSMILLILGYYDPIVSLISERLLRFRDLPVTLSVLGICALGIASGFILMSFVMRRLLSLYPRRTYFAIIGLIIGSVPTAYISVMRSSGLLPWDYGAVSAVTVAVSLFMLLFGFLATYYLCLLPRMRVKGEMRNNIDI